MWSDKDSKRPSRVSGTPRAAVKARARGKPSAMPRVERRDHGAPRILAEQIEDHWGSPVLPCQNDASGYAITDPKAQAYPRRIPGRTTRCVDINHFSCAWPRPPCSGLTRGRLHGRRNFQRGYIVDEQALVNQVKKGMSGEQVLTTLGTPSTVSTVGNKSWYYISQKSSRRFQFMPESVVDQTVTAVYFDNSLRVERSRSTGFRTAKCSTSSAARPRPAARKPASSASSSGAAAASIRSEPDRNSGCDSSEGMVEVVSPPHPEEPRQRRRLEGGLQPGSPMRRDGLRPPQHEDETNENPAARTAGFF